MTPTTWKIDQPDFRCTDWRPVMIRGERWLMAECQELVGGRWEGFVSIKKEG